MQFRLIGKMAWRDWRSGELGLLLVSLVVAVATVTAISLFVDRLHQALLLESADFLAADRYIGSSRAIPDNFREAASARDIQLVDTLLFPSMVFGANDTNQLVSVKAVAAGYPLRGVLKIADVPFTQGTVTQDLPSPGEVWLDARLFPALGVGIGDSIDVGLATFKVAKVITQEPDRGGSMFDLGPRLLMRLQDVPGTDVVQPGSRLSYRLLLKGADDQLEALRAELPLKPNYRWVGIKESSPSIGAALERAESYLLLGGLLAVLLAGIAVALSAHRYAQRHYDHVGVLKTLGGTPGQITQGFVGVLCLVGMVAIALGLAMGAGLHLAVVAVLKSMLPVELPPASFRPYILGAVTGSVCALAFALPPLIHLRNVSPMRVIRRDLAGLGPSRLFTYGAGIGGIVVLLLWYSGSVQLTLLTLLGSVGVLVLFGGLALALLYTGRVLGMQARSVWRLALAGLQRRRNENVAQILIFGLAIMLLLILILLRSALLEEWRGQLPDDAPNHFVMNITPTQVTGFTGYLKDNTPAYEAPFAMVRGRITQVNGMPAAQWMPNDGQVDGVPNIGSERNLTWAEEMPAENQLVSGQWWSASPLSQVEVSLEEDYANGLKLSIGDELIFDIAGRPLTAKIASVRRLKWESMRPNFYIIFSPGALEGYPTTYMTSFYLPKDNKQLLNDMLSSYPTITVIEIDALIEQVQTIIARVSQAIELVLSLVIVAGCLVLVASIQASRDSRMAEQALIRTLGGTRKLIAGSLALEFLFLGLLSGLVAAIGSEITAALLQSQVFELPVRVHPWVWVAGPVAGGLLVSIVGVISTLKLINTPPMLVLRGLN